MLTFCLQALNTDGDCDSFQMTAHLTHSRLRVDLRVVIVTIGKAKEKKLSL
jgi:hypothetical protein